MRSDATHHRLFWRSRRGMLELEFRLVPFVEQRYIDLPVALQEAYRALLEHEDWEIFDWLQGRAEVPVELVDIVAEIQKFGEK